MGIDQYEIHPPGGITFEITGSVGVEVIQSASYELVLVLADLCFDAKIVFNESPFVDMVYVLKAVAEIQDFKKSELATIDLPINCGAQNFFIFDEYETEILYNTRFLYLGDLGEDQQFYVIQQNDPTTEGVYTISYRVTLANYQTVTATYHEQFGEAAFLVNILPEAQDCSADPEQQALPFGCPEPVLSIVLTDPSHSSQIPDWLQALHQNGLVIDNLSDETIFLNGPTGGCANIIDLTNTTACSVSLSTSYFTYDYFTNSIQTDAADIAATDAGYRVFTLNYGNYEESTGIFYTIEVEFIMRVYYYTPE